jgi:hypothetical protein
MLEAGAESLSGKGKRKGGWSEDVGCEFLIRDWEAEAEGGNVEVQGC